jgi:hypothetical protein
MTDLPKDPHQARMFNFGRKLLGLPPISYNELAEIPLPHVKSRYEHFELDIQKVKDEMEDFRIEYPDYMYSPHYHSYRILEQKLQEIERHRDKYVAEIARREELSPKPESEAEIQNAPNFMGGPTLLQAGNSAHSLYKETKKRLKSGGVQIKSATSEQWYSGAEKALLQDQFTYIEISHIETLRYSAITGGQATRDFISKILVEIGKPFKWGADGQALYREWRKQTTKVD